MRTSSSAGAKNYFGELIDATRITPVDVTECDKQFVEMMALEEYERLKALDSRKGRSVLEANGR
jgi:hypothetical protein